MPPGDTILLVEDQPLIRMDVVDYLVERGYRVDEAGTARDALYRIRACDGQIDAVILDLGLPDRPGDALATEIRATYPHIPIVVASGQSVAEMRRRFDSPTDMAFITKPYEFADLANAIESLRRTLT